MSAVQFNQQEAFKAGCAAQREAAALIERVQAKLLALAEELHDEPTNWAIVGDVRRINESLTEVLGE